VNSNLAILCLQLGERGLALEQYGLLKSINYEMAEKVFALIYKDKVLDARRR